MSHHLDSPLARQDPRLNITDQYVFDDADATVLIMNVHTSLAGDSGPSGFHDVGRRAGPARRPDEKWCRPIALPVGAEAGISHR